MSAQYGMSDAGDWSIGGTLDERAADVLGFTEQEAALAATFAYQAVSDPAFLKLGGERLRRAFFDSFRDGVLCLVNDDGT